MDNIPLIKKSIIVLSKEFGKAFPISQILGANPDFKEDEVMEAILELISEGIVTQLDEDSIQVNV